jgi:RNAse (barnase) inhibitor barstar
MTENNSHEPHHGLTTVANPRTCAAEARRQGKLVVWVPRSVRSKEKLLGILAQGLRFPRYFGWNWDALEECLRDLSWLPENASILIVHEQLPFGEGENRQIYLDILKSAIDANKAQGRTLTVVVGE